MTTKLSPWVVLFAVALTLVSGCAKKDWIDRTLVTVDVTGTWVGSSNRPAGGSTTSFEARLELEQQGPKVKGKVFLIGSGVPAALTGAPSGPIEGTVTGDVFSFSQTNGVIVGEMTVDGDEMRGYVRGSAQFPMSFRRFASPRPTS